LSTIFKSIIENSLTIFGRLFHQYLVDMWAKIEMGRLKFLKHNQDKLRIELYSGLVDILNRLDSPRNFDNTLPTEIENNPNNVGKSVILPSNFVGGHRHMNQLYQDAMSVVRELGKPDLFITFTCNPAWPEIAAELLVKNHLTDLISSQEFLK
jgi:hypothetical protein